jgi:hypothetical protein
VCYGLSRRNLIASGVGVIASSLGLSGISKDISMDVVSDLFERRKTVADLLASVPHDKADRNKSYLRGTDMSDWHSEVHPFLEKLGNLDLVPAYGRIVEMGSYQGHSLQKLNSVFGADRVIGLDIHAYTKNPQILIGDIRSEVSPLRDGPAALVWNDVSNWNNSPRSKIAAFEWAKRNLVTGGIYVDDAMKNLPIDLDLRGFSLIFSRGYVTAFRKT